MTKPKGIEPQRLPVAYRHMCYWGPGDRVGGPAREGSEEGRKRACAPMIHGRAIVFFLFFYVFFGGSEPSTELRKK